MDAPVDGRADGRRVHDRNAASTAAETRGVSSRSERTPVTLQVARRGATTPPTEASSGVSQRQTGGGRGSSNGDADPDRGSRANTTNDDPAEERASWGAPATRAANTEQRWSPATASQADVDRLVDRLYREFERKLRVERERRGL